jgi:hypothetical protein
LNRFGDWPTPWFVANLNPVTLQKCALTVLLFAAILICSVSACSSSGSDGPAYDPTAGLDGGAKDGAGEGGGGGDQICLLNNCDIDRDCADCTSGRTTCLQAEHRCIACQPGSSGTCQQGQYCTKFGDCVPNGTTCAADATGTPTISCNADTDCAACDPHHKVCDASAHKCVGCLTTNVTNCQSTDVCANDTCVPKCPATCSVDADCGQCGVVGKEAHACNNHRCAACSATSKCPGGSECDVTHGTCAPVCGEPGKPQVCANDTECAGCKGGATHCNVPVNGGTGKCGVSAPGCSELGKGVVVLPEPFSSVTNTCSTDADCSTIDANINVGKIIRDITGIDAIKDSSIPYPMHACASITIPLINKDCGICVPCKQDADCTDIDITKVAGDAFGPLGSVAAALLLDKVFGPNDHKVHMYCEPVVDGYGVCAPCSNILRACGGEPPPAAGAPCNHDVCTPGGPLGTQCEQCTGDVCAHDQYCCDATNGQWDALCKREVDEYCTTKTCADPDTCQFKKAGWYCSTLQTNSSYECDDSEQIVIGYQCTTSQYCHKNGPNPKDTAILAPPGDGGAQVPQCFATP